MSQIRLASAFSSGVYQSEGWLKRGGACGTRSGSDSLRSAMNALNQATRLGVSGMRSATAFACSPLASLGRAERASRNATEWPDEVSTSEIWSFPEVVNNGRWFRGQVQLPGQLSSQRPVKDRTGSRNCQLPLGVPGLPAREVAKSAAKPGDVGEPYRHHVDVRVHFQRMGSLQHHCVCFCPAIALQVAGQRVRYP